MSGSPDIRRPAVAGMFYPAQPGELTKAVAGLFAEAEKPSVAGYPRALIVPHAGYAYSGAVAARAYKLLEGCRYDTVVIVSPSHTVFFAGASVYEGDGYETPLGTVAIDKELAARIASVHPSVYLSRQGHATGSTRGEHALEVQLPFLQVVLGQFKLVAIVIGDQEDSTVRGLGQVLGATLKDTNTLMIASTDLSHFHSEKTARRLDGTVRDAVEKFDPDLLLSTLQSGKGEACGGSPMAAVMTAAKRLGEPSISVVGYATSGETTGDFENVVGYLSAAITVPEGPQVDATIGSPAARKDSTGFSEEDREYLRRIAREAIRARLDGTEYSPSVPERLSMKRGGFVTLKIENDLRGCIGQILARAPLPELIAEMAVAAAFEDPRFVPLTETEFDQIDIELSILTPLERVHDLSEVQVGRDGLMIKLGTHSGLLLPQVASEQGWDRAEFLEHTCLKAGLGKNSYKDRLAEVYRFSAEVF